MSVTGKTLHYWQNSLEQAIDGISNFDRAYTMLEATDTSVASPGKASTSGRAKTSIDFASNLRAVLGAEVATGTLTAGTVYQVTAKDTVLSAYSVGELFTAAGTETMSSTDKVKPLGAKLTGKTLAVTIGGSTFKCITANYDVNYDEFDATDTSVTSPNMSSTSGRAKVTSQLTALMYRDTADQITNADISAQAVVVTFASGITVTGNATLHQMSISDSVNDICKVTYNLEWQGMPTEVGIGYLTMATEQTCQIIWEKGSSTNKEITGTVLLLGKSVTSDVNSDAKVTYKGILNGAITPAVYS